MFCEQCGNKLPENAMFCPKCGTSCSDGSYYNYDDVYNWHDKVSDMKNVYTLYTSAGAGDIYSGLIFEQDGLIGELDSLTDKDYSWMFLDSYRIKDGKIY